MERTFCTQSLLPWFDSGAAKIHLEISLHGGSVPLSDKRKPPFLFLDSSSPLFHLIHACYKTPSGKPIKEIFLLVQKDVCTFADRNTPFNNPGIDKFWLDAQAFAGFADGLETLEGLLDNPVDKTSSPLWQSLFYCEKRTCYFHPPCPECGNLLELCHRDEILSAAGLPRYRTSLERFLFCPVCHIDRPESDFYAYDRGDDVSPRVKNLRALVDGFKQLVKNGLAGEDFPCQTCKEQNDCYGSDLFPSRISPFAFYPFRMLIADAAQLPAQDFISMISGASCAEIRTQPHMIGQAGRSACLASFQQRGTERLQLFFENDSKKFLETLYVKIALLEQIVGAVFAAQKNLKHPELRLSIDQFWVDFPRTEGLLPLYWNFRVKPVALGIFPSEETPFVHVPESFSRYFLALLWFNTLLVNREQSVIDVQQALAMLFERESKNALTGEPDFLFSKRDDRRVFDPGNIFWYPLEEQLPASWLDLWKKVLGLGWSLLQASFQREKFSESLFVADVTQLAENIKENLFSSRSEPVQVESAADTKILKILLAIQEKWQTKNDVVQEDIASEPELEIASKIEPEFGPDPEKIGCLPEKEQPPPLAEDLEKTVILSGAQLAAMMGSIDKKDVNNLIDASVGRKSGSDVSAAEDLEKTVIMNVNDLEEMRSDAHSSSANPGLRQSAPPQSKNGVDDELSETVIISLEQLEKLTKGKNGNK